MTSFCDEIVARINYTAKPRSAWDVGVVQYMFELVDNVRDMVEYNERNPRDVDEVELWMLNGASDWKHFSWSGCSLCYNSQIAKRLCTASELKKTQNGMKRPNRNEDWLDVQARALWQAAQRIRYICVDIFAEG